MDRSYLPARATDFVSRGFRSGYPSRLLLDEAARHYGPSWLASARSQHTLVSACFSDTACFHFGRRRERQFLRLIMDAVDREAAGDVAESLTTAVVDRVLAARPGAEEEEERQAIEICGRHLRISSAFSDICMRLWESGVAAFEALRCEGNVLRETCRRKSVLEIGSGTGLLGFGLQDLAESTVLTDLPKALDNLRYNCPDGCSVRELDVFDEQQVLEARGWEFDVVIGADLFYDPDLGIGVVHALSRLLPGARNRKAVVFSRRRCDATFKRVTDVLDSKRELDNADISEEVLAGLGKFPFCYWDYSQLSVLEIAAYAESE